MPIDLQASRRSAVMSVQACKLIPLLLATQCSFSCGSSYLLHKVVCNGSLVTLRAMNRCSRPLMPNPAVELDSYFLLYYDPI